MADAFLAGRLAGLYLAFVALANPADAEIAENLLVGDMRGLVVHEAPQEVPEATFLDVDGAEHTLEPFLGRHVVLNFWATWCAPCRHEMPSLDALQAQLGGEHFAVVTVAVGRNPPQGIRRFFEEEGIENLPTYRDTSQQFARGMSVLGLPITVMLDPEGREIARLRGDADWASPEAVALVRALIDPDGDAEGDGDGDAAAEGAAAATATAAD